jgi:hypothetical protein
MLPRPDERGLLMLFLLDDDCEMIDRLTHLLSNFHPFLA